MYLGIDLGATNLRILIGDQTAILGRYRTSTPDDTSVAAALREGIHRVCDNAECDPAEIELAGIATIGPIVNGRIRSPVNLPNVDDLDVRALVASVIGSGNVALLNDATAAAVAEAAATDEDHLVYLTLSTGVGAGVVSGGEPFTGCQGNAGEVGHVTLAPDSDVQCGCGGYGHWEALCGGANLPAHARSLVSDGIDTELDVSSLDPESLLTAVDVDPLADALLTRISRFNVRGAGLLVCAYDPAKLIVGGGLAINHPETILAPMQNHLQSHCLGEAPPVEGTRFGDEAAARGALTLARQRDRNR